MDRKAPWLLLAVTLFAHFQLLFHDGLAWDSWMLERLIRAGNWGEVRAWFTDSGLPPLWWTHRVLGTLPNGPLAYKWVTFLAIWAAAVALFRLLRSLELATPWEAIGIAALATTWPAYKTAALGHIMTPYHLCLAAFLWAWVALVPLLREGVGARESVWRAGLGTLLLLYAFTINSLLMLHGAVWVIALAARWRRGVRPWRGIGAITWSAATIWVAPEYWSAKETLWPRRDIYESYNRVSSDFMSVSECFFELLSAGVDLAVREIVWAMPFALPLAALFWWILWRYRLADSGEAAAGGAERDRKLWGLFGAVAVLIAGLLPYALALRSPTITIVNTRHLLLTGIPVAAAFVFSGSLLVGGPRSRRVTSALLILAIVASGFVVIRDHAILQFRSLRDRAMLERLKVTEGADGFMVYEVDDRRTVVGPPFHYSFYHWGCLLSDAFGDGARLGLWVNSRGIVDPFPKDARLLSARYSVSGVREDGPRARITVRDGAAMPTWWRAVVRYHWLRLTGDDAEMQAYLVALSRIHVRASEGY